MIETPLRPEVRRFHDEITGTPVKIDGQTWLFADWIAEISERWDNLFDANALSRCYANNDLRFCALSLLETNYQLAPGESVGLVRGVKAIDLRQAVEFALYGAPKTHVTYSAWCRTALLAAGLDPQAIAPQDRRAVLTMLVQSGRVTPMHEAVTSLITAAKFAGMQALARNCVAAQEQAAARSQAAPQQPPTPTAPLLNPTPEHPGTSQ
jgi:hypothetical protein